MDLESFETIEIQMTEDSEEFVKEGGNVEYWDVEGIKIIKRAL